MAAILSASLGCQIWPFGVEKDRTTMITPAMRTASIREFGPRGRKASGAEQQRICQQLASQIQTEPDPIVRKAIQETIAEFQDPLATAVLLAGLNDDDREVRVACCRKLGQRKEFGAVAPLRELMASDDDVDVRLAAVDALGAIGTTAAMQAIGPALTDREVAMQYAGVQALRLASGEKLGNQISAWQQYVEGLGPATSAPGVPGVSADRAMASKAGDSLGTR